MESKLGSALQDVKTILEDHQAFEHWMRKIEAIQSSSGGSYGRREARQIISWYGGMGSFNDLMISTMNGHCIRPEDASEVNLRLNILLSTVYDEAVEILESTRGTLPVWT